jgi:hypothetical protein
VVVAEAIDDLIARAEALPERLRSLRVSTEGWFDDELTAVASARARKVQARLRPGAHPRPPRRSSERATSWFVFGGAEAWSQPGIGIWPGRWREELEFEGPTRPTMRRISGRDGDAYWWEHGAETHVTDARRLRSSLASGWVVGRSWTRPNHARQVVGRTTHLDRAIVRLRVTPEQGAALGPGPLHAGDAHELAIDVATGLTVALTNFVDDQPFQHHEVTELELDPVVAPELTAAPAGAIAVPPSAGNRSIEEIAADTDLAVFRATWLPDGFAYQAGAAYGGEYPHVSITYARGGREFVSLHASPAEPIPDDRYEWIMVQRGSRTVAITDVGDTPGERIAHTTLDGTRIVVVSSVPADQLLDIAFSLAVVTSTR